MTTTTQPAGTDNADAAPMEVDWPPAKVVKAMKAIVAHYWPKEVPDAVLNGGKDHIFNSLQVIDGWLTLAENTRPVRANLGPARLTRIDAERDAGDVADSYVMDVYGLSLVVRLASDVGALVPVVNIDDNGHPTVVLEVGEDLKAVLQDGQLTVHAPKERFQAPSPQQAAVMAHHDTRWLTAGQIDVEHTIVDEDGTEHTVADVHRGDSGEVDLTFTSGGKPVSYDESAMLLVY
jgi:hypothetical protein